MFLFQADIVTQPHELEVQMEVENLTVKEFSQELSQHASRPDISEPTPQNSGESRDMEHKPKKRKHK